MKILFATSELDPVCKVGGLADVARALPKALRALGQDVRMVLPFYEGLAPQADGLRRVGGSLRIAMGDRCMEGQLWEATMVGDLPAYLVENSEFFGRPSVYGPGFGYEDNFERYVFFSKAVLEVAKQTSFSPEIYHCQDWMTASVAALHSLTGDADVRTVLTIHNLAYQGTFPREKMSLLNLPQGDIADRFMAWGQGNLLCGGIRTADTVSTVSATHAREIQMEEFGCGLHAALQERGDYVYGITNALDDERWDPAKDKNIIARYAGLDLAAKARCKKDILQWAGLGEKSMSPVVAMISRLVQHKGLDLLLGAIEAMAAMDIVLVVLGEGLEHYEEALRGVQRQFPGHVLARIGYDDGLAHRLHAGADMLLMPSLFEPCGLTQIYALKYGTIPVCTGVGGLADTVYPFDAHNGSGNGFRITERSVDGVLETLREALAVFADKPRWTRLMANAMASRFSWREAAESYTRMFESTLSRPRHVSWQSK